MHSRTVIRTPAEGPILGVVGDVYRFLATGAETDGKYAMWEALVPPGGGPPPHMHTREEESFYILEGEISIQIDDQHIVATAGTFANLPVGSLHSFTNATDQPARMIITIAPAGLEQMFFDIGRPLSPGEPAPLPSREEIGRLLAIAATYGLEFNLPPSS